MFTGLISDVGQVGAVREEGRLRRLRVSCGYDAATIEVGASIAHAGVCLTVVSVARAGNRAEIEVDVGAETLGVTTAGQWRGGTRLNLERPLRLGDELGGHMVSGHVDGVAEIIAREDFDGMARFDFRAPAGFARFIAQKGSVALDGTSLTVNSVEGDAFSVLLIPHTLTVTTWGERQAGDHVNIEVDQMARYAARLIEAGGAR
jgi:riboflavin synthase